MSIPITKAVKIQNINKAKHKLKYSNFYITINTNKQFKNIESQECKQMQQQLKNCINNCFNNIKEYIIIKDVNKDVKLNKQWIKSINLDAVVEVGEIKKQPHAHLLISMNEKKLVFRC